MKQPKYLEDPYLQEYATQVTEANGKLVVLEDTIFYAQGGGQPSDKGTITRDDGQVFNIVIVRKSDGKITHEVDAEGLQPKDSVVCRIDWERRYKLMRTHTAAHIMSSVLLKSLGGIVTGNNLDVDKFRMDINIPPVEKEVLDKYTQDANAIVDSDLPIIVSSMTRAEVEAKPEMVKLAKGLPPNIEVLRIVAIGTFDIEPDGGTHVKSTKEVGHLKFIKSENKGANNRRMYWELA